MWRRVLSQSPLVVHGPNSAYIKAFAAIGELMRGGRSLSGHERHCCFLNTADGKFATISAASGLDLPEDGRAIGLSDWDHDGDLDVWLSNRTGPRLRFFRNDMEGSAFISFRLTGRTVNRDAIGARLELHVRPDASDGSKRPATRLIRTLHAGHGFLSQASKRVHFGLGKRERIEKLIVRWPGGAAEEFVGLEPNCHYDLIEGQPYPTEWRRESGPLAAQPSVLRGATLSNQSRVVIIGRLPMPAVDFRDIQKDAKSSTSAPLLVNLWSTSCHPCLAELAEFTRHEPEIRSAGLNIIALNVDELNDNPQSDLAHSKDLLRKMSFPFAAAAIDPEVSGTLDVFHRAFLNLRRPLPIPSSFLATPDGRVAVIYRGPVTVDQVLRDLPILAADAEQVRNASVPFAGRWFNPTWIADPKQQAVAFLRSGFLNTGKAYLEKYLIAHQCDQGWGPRDRWPSRERLAELCDTLADYYRLKNEPQGVLASYRLAILFNPRSASAHLMLGKGMIALGQTEEGLKVLETAYQLEPRNFEMGNDLAIGYAMADKISQARKLFEQLLRDHPNRAELHWHLARACRQQRDFTRAIEHLRKYLAVHPRAVEAIHSLAWLLATAPGPNDRNIEEAAEWAERWPAAATGGSADYHDLLAAIHAARGEFDQAIRRVDQALDIVRSRGDSRLLEPLRARRELYRQRKPYVEAAE